MRVLIVHERGIAIELPELDIPVTKNSMPPDDGIAVYEMGKEPDWSWPEYTVTVGTVNIGRNARDAHIDAVGDYNSQIRRIIDSLAEQVIEDDEDTS